MVEEDAPPLPSGDQCFALRCSFPRVNAMRQRCTGLARAGLVPNRPARACDPLLSMWLSRTWLLFRDMKAGRDLMPEVFEEKLNDVIRSGAYPPTLSWWETGMLGSA